MKCDCSTKFDLEIATDLLPPPLLPILDFGGKRANRTHQRGFLLANSRRPSLPPPPSLHKADWPHLGRQARAGLAIVGEEREQRMAGGQQAQHSTARHSKAQHGA